MKKGLRLPQSPHVVVGRGNEHRPDEKGIATMKRDPYVGQLFGTNTDLMKKGLRLFVKHSLKSA